MTQEWLVYTEEDLVALTNRGTVKRATREFQEDGLTATFVHTDQVLEVHWSDAVTCVFVASRPLSEVFCSCPAAHLCRHVIRSVLAIQKAFASNSPEEAEGPWSPGEISDSQLLTIFTQDALSKAKQKIASGIVVELHPGTRPLVRILTEDQTVQFRLRTDLSSASCTCAKTTLCDHLLLATLAFRLKIQDGIERITTQDESPLSQASTTLLQRVEDTLFALMRTGFARVDATSLDRLRNLANTLYSVHLTHPAEVLEDIITEVQLYIAHDARFSAARLAALLGEFAIRHDALKAAQIPIPRFFVRGQTTEGDLQIGQGRLMGLGCLCDSRPNGVMMRVMLYDAMATRIVEISHFFANTSEELADFAELGRRLVFSGRSLDTCARGQIVARHTQISSTHRLNLGQQNMSVYAQNLAWEELPPTLLIQNFDDLAERIKTTPPAALQRRVIGEDFVVLAIQRVDHVRFDDPQQRVCAMLWDRDTPIRLNHPYVSRGRNGAEHLLNVLLSQSSKICFVAGQIRSISNMLEIQPSALVIENGDGTRQILLPFLEDAAGEPFHMEIDVSTFHENALQSFRQELLTALGECVMLGLTHAHQTIDLDNLAIRAQDLGLTLPAQSLRASQNPDFFWHALTVTTLTAQL